MSKMWAVAAHEFRRYALRKSFVWVVFSVPLLLIVIAVGTRLPALLRGQPAQEVAAGYVDLAGVLASTVSPLPTDAGPPVRWIAFPTEQAAVDALEKAEIAAYFVVAADYRQTRQVELVYVDEPGGGVVRQFQALLQANLLAGQPAAVVRRAIEGSQQVMRSPDGRREFAGRLTPGQLLPGLSGLAFVALILVGADYLVQAVVEEKASRTIEILATSLPAGQLVGGKVIGIAAVTLAQFGGWIVLVALAAAVGSRLPGFAWLGDLRMEPQAIVMLVALVLPAYALVAALMVAIGTALNDAQASRQVAMFFITLCLMPLALVLPLLRAPDSALAAGLSLVPLIAPVILPLRALFTAVPWWQVAAAAGIQGALALGALWLATRTLRLGMLRYGKRLDWRELLGLPAPARSGLPVAGTRPASQADAARGGTPQRGTRKTLSILRHELITTLARPWYVLMTLGFPLLVFLQLVFLQLAAPSRAAAGGLGEATTVQGSVDAAAVLPVGYVDPGGVLQALPADVPPGALVAYASEADARRALAEGQIAAFYEIPADYLATGRLVCVSPTYNPLAPAGPFRWLSWALLVNVVGGDAGLATRVWSPMELHAAPFAPAAGAESDTSSVAQALLTRYLPMLVTLLLYGVIVLASSLLVQCISGEKKNRVIEILLLSASPRQLLGAKIAALGIAGLLQAAAWIAIAAMLFALIKGPLNLPAGIALPPSLALWAALYFLLGYALYGSLIAGAGALTSDPQELPKVSMSVYAPALIGFLISLNAVDDPHSAMVVAASIFPLTAPFAMVARVALGGVPWWQLLLSVGLTAASVPLVVRAVAGMFQAQNLLSGQPYSARRYLRALLGKGEGPPQA